MKKISLLIFAAAAVGAVGCSQESVQEVNPSSIGFTSNTSRATSATLATLQGDDTGFVVYGTKANGGGAWDSQMSGDNYYLYNDGVWGWSMAAPAWPDVEDDADEYPIDFYAIYSLDKTGLTISGDSQEELALTYAAPTAKQSDILVAENTTAVRPAGDKLPLEFKHILSKAEFTIKPGDDVTVYTQAVGFNNICSERDYDIYNAEWKDQVATNLNDYSYLDTKNPATNSDEAAIEGTNGSLMVIPQQTTSWHQENNPDQVNGSHIYLFYRAETSADSDYIGYAAASSHPDFDPDDDAALKDMPLFVKVGFPLGATDFIAEAGNSYNYNIQIGTDDASNGYVLDKYYYDADGNVTTFEVKGKEINDPLADGYINFTVSVKEWVENTPAVL